MAASRALFVVGLVLAASARNYRSLPPGSLIVAYATVCNSTALLREVEAGVNVLIWFSISLGPTRPTEGTDPVIVGGPNASCVAEVRSMLDAAGYNDVAHMISIGGWDAPHPNTTVADGSTWWRLFEKWNVHPTDTSLKLYDGIDWDLEGNDAVHSPYNHFSIECLRLVHQMSASAKEAGAIVSLVPGQSYFDVSSSTFDRSLLHNYPDWHPEFNYRGRNAYVPLVAWNASLYDFVDVQLYETWSRAAQAVEQQSLSADTYLIELVRQMINGSWHVDFSGDPAIGINHTVSISISPKRLVLGFSRGNGKKAPERSIYIDPHLVGRAFASLNTWERPRGCMFWNADLDGGPCWSPDGAVSRCAFASGFNSFLQVRPLHVLGTAYV